MEKSTCHKMVIVILKQISSMKRLFLHCFISLKHDFHVDAESMIVRTQDMSKYLQTYFTLCTKFFRRGDLSISIDQMINY